jgi:hypothetical protein
MNMNKKRIIIISAIAAALVLTAGLSAAIINWAQPEIFGNGERGTAEAAQNFAPTPGPTPIATGASFAIAPTSLGDIAIRALSATDLGIAIDSAFLLSSDVRTLTREHLLSYLSVRSGESFILEEQPDNAFLLRFGENLENNQVYNFVWQPTGQQAVSYAFQTADIFRVASTSPADSTHGIPNNAGIEVTFSQEPAGPAGHFENVFSIHPHVDGRFLQRDNTHIFVPDYLEFGTRYTVTISRGLTSVTGEVMEEDHVFAFTTQWGTAAAPPFSLAGSAYETFLPWDEVLIAMNVLNGFAGREFSVRLYDLHTAENFVNFTDTDAGSPVDAFEIGLREFQTEWESFFYLFLERTLPEGYYVAEIRSENIDVVLHKFIQVSALSVYSLSIDGEAVFWVHDAVTGQPAAGAQIRIDGAPVSTNSDGIAIAETGQRGNAVITIEYGNHLPFVYTKPTFAQRLLIPGDRFLSYMYTDRPSYRPNDTVDIFGVIMPRYGHSHLPGDVFTLHFGDMIELPIALDAHNSFAMRVPVTNMFSGVSIEVRVNGERLMSRWVNFVDYTNLSFVLEGELDRLAYFSGEYARAEISVTTFAGMPVEGITLRHGWDADGLSIVTDNEGVAAGNMPVPRGWGWANTWEPQWSDFWFSVIGDAQMSQSVGMPKIIVPSDIMMEHEFDGGDTATITTSRILIDRINQHYANALPWTPLDRDIYRGPAADVDFTVEITRHVTTRTIRYTNYDHINRRTINIYNFDTTSSHYRTISGRTQGGEAVITGLPVSDDILIRYSIEINYADSAGRENNVRLLDNHWFHFPQESTIRRFGLVLGSSNLRVNETTQVSVIENPNDGWHWTGGDFEDGSIALTEGRLLTILFRDRIISAAAGNPQGMPVTFTEECISSALIFGAYFDGRHIFPVIHPVTLTYDFTERQLEIELDFDQSRYQPGDEVTVTIQTSAPAQVLISVVDESAILNSWHQANFLSALYRSSWVWWPASYEFVSHTQHNFGGGGGGAEGGGNGDAGFDGNFRDHFIDNPIFEIVQTDRNGRGRLTFTLPDQVTSWRITAIGLTQDGFAGDARYNIISHLDFYVDLLLTNEYIAGDDIAAVARAFGSDGGPVSFTFNVLQDGAIIHTDSQVSVRSAAFNAGKLGAGDYIMQVAATWGANSDAVELPFAVAETGMILPMSATARIAQTADTSAITGLNMRPLPVRVTLTNADIGPVVNILNGIRTGNSFRTDYMAAAAYINYFFTGDDIDFNHIRPLIQASSGGIPELIYEDADFYYTARFAASFPEFVNREGLVRYIHRELADAYALRRAAGLLALAAMGEPVLLEIQREIENTTDDLARLYLAAALVAIGDDAGAAALAAQISADFGQNSSITERETANTLRLFINTTINPLAAWAHINRGYANQHVSDVPERINFVRRTQLLGTTISEVQYYLNGATHTARLENFDRLSLHLTKEQFDALNLVPISGATDFHIDFFGYDAGNWEAADNRISIQRTIVRDGDLFRIDLNVNVPADARGFYTIYDRLPSNMRFVPLRQDRQGGHHFSVRHVQGQLVEISFFVDQGTMSRTLSYHAMELFEADMAGGTTFISNGCAHNHIWGMTE